MSEFWNDRLILKTYAGSISYGTNTPESDTDYRGVCIPPKEYLLGLKSFDQHEQLQPTDEVIYSLRKFVNLAMANNPNIIDVLFVDQKHVVFENAFGKDLRNIRESFLSKNVYKTYGGYAHAQLKRMTTVAKNSEGKRLDSVDKYGYDTKNALHLIRLLRMGIEILETGAVNVFRPDGKELLEIRAGKYTKEEILAEANKLYSKLDTVYETSDLPRKPDFDTVNEWLIRTQEEALKW